MTRRTSLWLSRILWVSVMAYGSRFLGQDKVELPNVKFQEPSPKTFQLEKRLQLRFQSDIAPAKLHARLFPGSKEELKAKARFAPPGTCVSYGSWVSDYAGADGGVEFNLFFGSNLLNQVSNTGFDNREFTVVLEEAEPQLTNFRLYSKDVADYFDRGLEIVLVAPDWLRSGKRAEAEIAKLHQAPQTTSGSSQSESANNSHPPDSFQSDKSKHAAGSKNRPEGTLETCIVIHSKGARASADSQPAADGDQLAEVACLGLGMPELIHWPPNAFGLRLRMGR